MIMLMKKPTINDVARAANVSKRTVSRVLNDSASVGEETRKLIQKIIADLNYQPDKQARGLASSRSYFIGIIYDNPDALYIDQVQRGLLDVCSRQGYELVVHPCKYDSPTLVEDCLAFVGRSKLDGVIVLPPVSESKVLAAALRDEGTPYVRMASLDLDDHTNIVVSDDRTGVRQMAAHLVGLGHRDIGFITGPMHYHSSTERFEGFCGALKDLGLPIPEGRIKHGKNNYQSGLECARALLAGEGRPTAIFANTDEMAAAVLKVAHELGIKVPEELSVCGFDDNILASRIIPALTTIRRPVTDMAGLAAQKIISAIENKDEKITRVNYIVQPSLIIRDSTSQRLGTEQ